MKILADFSLPHLEVFNTFFEVDTYKDEKELYKRLQDHEILICRSTLKVNATLLKSTQIKCVATASSGIDHINTEFLAQMGIPLFHAKGSNAQAVADYVIATIAYLDKEKCIKGKKAGIIGLGEVGTQVERRLKAAGFSLCCYDPPKSHRTESPSCSLDDLFTCDLICIHPNLHDKSPYPSKHLIDGNFLNKLQENTILINASRGGVVEESALLSHKHKVIYCTDVYENEPEICPEIIGLAKTCTPHIAGHSIEAKISAVFRLCEQIHSFYDLPSPAFPFIDNPETSIVPHARWQDVILSLYDPSKESLQLKNAKNKKEAFLRLRKEHKTRHDFLYYNAGGLDQEIQFLLGHSPF